MSETARLAEFAASLTFDRLPGEVVHTVKRIILDTLGTTLAAGTLADGGRQLLDMVRASPGPGEASLIGWGERVPAMMAALANGGLGHALNYDAGGKAGHLGSILAAPLAAAQVRGGTDGRRLITGLAAGLEVCARLAAAVVRGGPGGAAPADVVLEGQLLGYFGAAAASGSILGLDSSSMHSALGIALMQAAGSMQVVFDGDPPAKAVYAAFSNHGGLLSALLAHKGIGAKIAAFEGRAGLFALHFANRWDRTALTDGLGDRYRLLDVAFKPWPSSGITHPFIEAAQSLGTFAPHRLRAVRLRGGLRSRHWFEPESERRRPASGAAAANSVFYTVARTLESGTVRLDDFAGEAFHRAWPMIDLMSHSLDEELGASGIVELVTDDGRVSSSRVDTPLGAPQKPMTDSQLRDKFADCARFAPRPVDPDTLATQIFRLEKMSDVETLMAHL